VGVRTINLVLDGGHCLMKPSELKGAVNRATEREREILAHLCSTDKKGSDSKSDKKSSKKSGKRSDKKSDKRSDKKSGGNGHRHRSGGGGKSPGKKSGKHGKRSGDRDRKSGGSTKKTGSRKKRS
jgi:hypothetical protein